MDWLFNLIQGQLGLDPATFLLLLGVIVSVCNLFGRLIPDDAKGVLGFIRKVCKVAGLYLSNRVAGGISVNDTARAVAGATAITQRDANGKFQSTTLRSPFIVAILAGIVALLLAGCTPAQVGRVESTANAICTSAPLAQALYNSALATGDNDKVNQILDQLQAACPGVLLLIHTVPVKVPVPVQVPVESVGERG